MSSRIDELDIYVPLAVIEMVTSLEAEIERLREDNETLNEIIKVHGDEINRLRAERDDKRELLQQLRFIRTHLYAATVQRSPADDKIIADHVEQAYLRANEVIAEMEKCDE